MKYKKSLPLSVFKTLSLLVAFFFLPKDSALITILPCEPTYEAVFEAVARGEADAAFTSRPGFG